MPFQYDVFISYSRADEKWAKLLEQQLQQDGLTVFLDQSRITAGEQWNTALKQAIANSQHLVPLWSKHASASEWVRSELAYFDVQSPVSGGPARRMMSISLDADSNPVYGSLQAIDDVKRMYGPNVDPTNPAVAAGWRVVAAKVTAVVHDQTSSVPIPVCVVAMTQGEARGLDPGNDIVGRVPPLGQFLSGLGISSIEALSASYGARRRDWRPFGGDDTVETLLIQTLGRLPGPASDRPHRWEFIDFIAKDTSQAREEVAKLLTDNSLVLIDPISLYSPNILDRMRFLRQCFERDQTVVLALAPYAAPANYRSLREAVMKATEPELDFYYTPPVPSTGPYAQCVVGVFDDEEITRVMRAHIGRQRRTTEPGPGNIFTGMGGARS